MNKSRLLFLFQLLCAGLLFCSCSNQTNTKTEIVNVLDSSNFDSVNIINGIFDIPELTVIPSPLAAKSFNFSNSEKVIDYDVSPAGMNVAAIVEEGLSKTYIKFWQIGGDRIAESCILPDGIKATAISWHPRANALFIIGKKEGNYQIFKVERNNGNWTTKSIFSTPNQLNRILICPRPFVVKTDYKNRRDIYSYRLFLGMDNGNNSFRIVSITENGNRFYQVVGPSKTFTTFTDSDAPPSKIEAEWALPIAFHPAGHQLIWEDKQHKFFVASYDSKYWGDSKPLNIAVKSFGSIAPIPNGLGFIHWQQDKAGVGVYLLSTQKEIVHLPEYHFISKPVFVPDGKGIIGLTEINGHYGLNYLPIEIPLADVFNAWMFSESNEELDLFQKNFGLFRPDNNDQLYKLYETENYYCNSYDRNTPTRPYLVTTDIFWELFSAAYQGLFIVKERDEAIPNFWKFVQMADSALKSTNKNSIWIPVFQAIKDFNSGNNQNPEALRIIKEQDCFTEIINDTYAYSDLKPRGYYTSTPEMNRYFKAFRYFTTIFKKNPDALKELNSLPMEVAGYAERWIDSYSGFISSSRSPLVWNYPKRNIPVYCKHPGKILSIFPLSWGFDNEVLYSTVFHDDVPDEEKITGPNGPRMLPSGIDIAAVLGSGLAQNLLQSDFDKYPQLRKVIENLKENFKSQINESDQKDNLYNQWINALAVQWIDTVNSTNGLRDRGIWQTKRLQTGLASWATLRHSTILVNERGAAECGEGGFEEILMRAPRGYVEPDPYTFASIASLVETAEKFVSKSMAEKNDIHEEGAVGKRSLYDGIMERLKELANETHAFQTMAEKERKGETLTNDENERILFVSRTAEHLFLVFNSLANKDYALSNPDPIGKIADVFGDKNISAYLMVAVGNAMEWNHIVPYYGRHQIVKGSIYSYYEFSSEELLNDEVWRTQLKKQEILPWIKPYVTYKNASGSPRTCY